MRTVCGLQASLLFRTMYRETPLAFMIKFSAAQCPIFLMHVLVVDVAVWQDFYKMTSKIVLSSAGRRHGRHGGPQLVALVQVLGFAQKAQQTVQLAVLVLVQVLGFEQKGQQTVQAATQEVPGAVQEAMRRVKQVKIAAAAAVAAAAVPSCQNQSRTSRSRRAADSDRRRGWRMCSRRLIHIHQRHRLRSRSLLERLQRQQPQERRCCPHRCLLHRFHRQRCRLRSL